MRLWLARQLGFCLNPSMETEPSAHPNYQHPRHLATNTNCQISELNEAKASVKLKADRVRVCLSALEPLFRGSQLMIVIVAFHCQQNIRLEVH